MATPDPFTRRLLLLGDIMTSLCAMENAEELPRLAVRSMMDLFEAGAGFMTRLDSGTIRVEAAAGSADSLTGQVLPGTDAVRVFVGLDGPVRPASSGWKVPPDLSGLPIEGGAVMAAPVWAGGRLYGSLFLSAGAVRFSDEDAELLNRIASAVGASLHSHWVFSAVSAGQVHWQAIFDCITDAIFLQDEDSVILRANQGAARLAGIDLRQLPGRRALDVFPLPETVKGDPFRRAIQSGEPSFFEATQKGRQYLVSAFPIERAEGGARMCVHIRKDVSEVKQLQSRIFDSEKLLSVGRLVSGVAHEINNPLTGVIGYAELLLRRGDDPGMPKRELKKILDSALRCKSIVENLLAFSRQKPQERHQVNVNDIIENTLQLRSYWLRHGGIEVVKRYGELPNVTADPQLLQQAILNIVENAEDAIAEKHQKKGGLITIDTFYSENRVLVTITDNGPGIPEDLLSRVFDPFFTTKEVGRGAGLGLSSAYGIIRDHGGDLRVRSRAGEGATFIIELNRG